MCRVRIDNVNGMHVMSCRVYSIYICNRADELDRNKEKKEM